MKYPKDPNDWEKLFDNLDVAIMLIESDSGIIRRINQSVWEDLHMTREEILGVRYWQIFWPEFKAVFDHLANQCEDGKPHEIIYYWAERALWEQISARLVEWNGVRCILMSITKISEIARSGYKFENMAYFDHLLDMPNGNKFEEDITGLADVETVALIYFEIERLEEINNLYGYENGNNLLRQIRDWVVSSETRRAQFYRVNNGFAILGRKVTMESAKKRAKEILRRFDKPWILAAGCNELMLYCPIKLGIVYGKYIRNEMRNLVLRTIRLAKKNEEGYTIYDEQADRSAKHRLALRNTLINCICNNMEGFEVHYHPIVTTKSAQWMALEALCRWTTPDGSRVSPLEFIHMAEQLNLIDRLDTWVRRTAMTQCAALGLTRKKFILDVNFSPTQHLDDTFINGLFRTLRDTGFPPEKLNLEITESAKMVFDENNLNGLNRLRDRGIILSLDDFGTGYSSIANLINISAHVLKTDKIFIEDIEKDRSRQYLLSMLVDLTHHHNMSMVAEGVETQEQFDLLKRYNVDNLQGYLFSKPLSYDQLKEEAWRFQ